MSGPYRTAPLKEIVEDELTRFAVVVVYKNGDVGHEARRRWVLARDGAVALELVQVDIGLQEGDVWAQYVISADDFDYATITQVEGRKKK